jgi:hypothetical protein
MRVTPVCVHFHVKVPKTGKKNFSWRDIRNQDFNVDYKNANLPYGQ